MLTPDEIRNELRRAELHVRNAAAILYLLHASVPGTSYLELADELAEFTELELELADQEQDDGE